MSLEDENKMLRELLKEAETTLKAERGRWNMIARRTRLLLAQYERLNGATLAEAAISSCSIQRIVEAKSGSPFSKLLQEFDDRISAKDPRKG